MKKKYDKKIIKYISIVFIFIILIVYSFFYIKKNQIENVANQEQNKVEIEKTYTKSGDESKELNQTKETYNVRKSDYSATKSSDSHILENNIDENDYKTQKATLKIGEQKYDFFLSSEATAYDAMKILMAEGQITFKGKEYSGLGFFVTSIGPLVSGNGKNLFYYINGEEATVGISNYKIKEGDIIEWKLK